jgi:hypothetical protein
VRLFRRVVLGGTIVAGAASLIFAFFVNPASVPKPTAVASELLQNESFEQPASMGAWNPAADASFTIEKDKRAYDLESAARLKGRISQEVLLTPVPGRAYRFSLWVRRSDDAGSNAAAKTPGIVFAQTACAKDEEIQETPFSATDKWQEFSATVQPLNGQRCSMRVGIQAGDSVLVDQASFTDAGLVNPSFDLGDGLESWTVDRGVASTTNDRGGIDGKRYVQITSTKGGGIRQDALIDPSSQPIAGRASVWLRSPHGGAKVELQYREPCSQTVHRTSVVLNSKWRQISVRQARLANQAYPKDVVQVNGIGCRAQVAVVVIGNGTVDVDGAELHLSSYWPAEGNPGYQKAAKTLAANRGF